MKKQINVLMTVEAILLVDEDVPQDWDILKEVSHQISFDDAIEYEVKEVIIVGP